MKSMCSKKISHIRTLDQLGRERTDWIDYLYLAKPSEFDRLREIKAIFP